MSQSFVRRYRCRNRLSEHDNDSDDRYQACQSGNHDSSVSGEAFPANAPQFLMHQSKTDPKSAPEMKPDRTTGYYAELWWCWGGDAPDAVPPCPRL